MSTCPSTVKTCKKCGETKDLSEFYRKNSSVDGRENSCIDCRKEQMSTAYRARYKAARRRETHLMRTYAITPAVYDHMLLMQDGHCKLCSATTSGRKNDNYLIVDHCHTTDQIRGLLCHQCNIMLGAARDRPEILANAITYLSEYA